MISALGLVCGCGSNVDQPAGDAATSDTGAVIDSATDIAIDTETGIDSGPEAAFDSALPVDTGSDVGVDSEAAADTSMDASLAAETVVYGSPTPAASCDSAVTRVAELVTADACAALVRFTYETAENVGWQVRCDAPAPFTEASARMELAPYIAPSTKVSDYAWTTTPAPDPWLLFRSPGDFGGVGIGSFASGKLLFAGGVVWNGRGDIAYPKSFRPASELAMDCGAFGTASPRKFIASGEMKDTSDSAVGRVLRSPLLYGFLKKHSKLNAWVLGYPRTVGILDPKSAEWIVVVESRK